jgi:adenosylcobinamide kinase/adenosylcobinamide-phosphate guanylyltransferase
MPQRTLIIGGARSGKSRFAERLVAGAGEVTYVAPGYPAGADADWAQRVAAHQARRPGHWRTVETTDVAGVLAAAGADSVILVDCLGTWLTRVLDDVGAWSDVDGWRERADDRVDAASRAFTACRGTVVAVTNEVGLGVVPPTPAGRTFRDLLGRVNQGFGATADGLYLVVAGRALDLSAATVV